MRRHTLRLGAGAALLALAVTAAVALGAQSTTILKASDNASLHKGIVVDSKGKTVYRLSGETAEKFKCTSSACLGAWPPLTVTSKKTKLKAGAGVHGKLTVVKRSGVKGFQVLLGGKPLYSFAGDAAAGDAKGNGIASFGGTWSVLGATGSPSSSPTSTTTTSTTTSTIPSSLPGGGY
jgi:predicted lipoprotein with Yx(FWY)xxD motif